MVAVSSAAVDERLAVVGADDDPLESADTHQADSLEKLLRGGLYGRAHQVKINRFNHGDTPSEEWRPRISTISDFLSEAGVVIELDWHNSIRR